MKNHRLILLKWLIVLIPPAMVGLSYWTWHRLEDSHSSVGTLVVGFLALVLAYTFVEILFAAIRKLQADALAREQEMRTMNAVMQERERLSRELHDGVAQLVADVLLRLDTIKDLVDANRKHEAEAELERLHGVADEIYADIGESIAGLRTNMMERGLSSTLNDYVDQFEERHKIPTNLRVDASVKQFSHLAALQIFRFVQEALTNIRKHAGAKSVSVDLTVNGQGQMKVVIADDGKGFDPDKKASKARPLGLTSMRERVEGLGGTFHVESRPGSGTQVIATIPFD